MLATSSQRAYPRYTAATVLMAVLLVAIPALFVALDPGGGGDLVAGGDVVQTQADITFTAPDGWSKTETATSVILTKGTATIELRPVQWDGTPAELYKENEKDLGQALTIVSIDEPKPRDPIGGMDAVEGNIQMIISGQETSGYLVVAANGTAGLIADLFGPSIDIQHAKDEYLQVLSTVKLGGSEG